MKTIKSHAQTALKLLLIAAVLMLAAPFAAFPAKAAAGDTVILYTANLRGNIDVLPQIAQLKAQYESEGSEVILVDAGNYLQGTVYATHDSGQSVIDLMVATGYKMVGLGSHDFDFGNGVYGSPYHTISANDGSLETFLKTKEASLSAISANITKSGQDSDSIKTFSANQVITTGSALKIGFFGLSDPKTVNQVLETNLTGLTFADPAATAAAQKTAISANVKVALSNVGNLPANTADIVIDVSSAAGLTVGKVVLSSGGQVVSSGAVSLSGVGQNTAVKTAVDAYKATVDAAHPAASMAKSEVTLNGSNAAVRGGETNLGDFWTDALLWFAKEGGIASYYKQEELDAGNTGISVPANQIVAVWNGGNLRDYVNPGDFILKNTARILPYPNSVAVVYLTGSQLVELLESATQALPWSAETNAANAAFLQAAGMKYTVAAYKDYDKGEQYGTSVWFKANSLNRVTITEVNGKAFDKDAVYAVITSNAIYNGMDSNYICADKDVDKSTITSAAVQDVVWMYVTQKLNKIIGAQYAQPQGRITVLTAPPVNPTDDPQTDPSTDVKNETGNKQPADPVPPTGDTAPIAFCWMIVLASAAGLITATKKKQRA